ncbi:tRNA pseudouridine(13) synthase TruD [Candidatus Woesearchaeota archaeon]|jgi:tRNA pseudouridine13 synthase|nr:tRNA pseudouridine(13) synthase TruD [Candidatus Woesearchaeota archaeon]MBT4387710.1 tRNA pseudouridine(13) synthase TruD [Candidatus Woesearchaeota archaeon]MBT4595889.1 tRNA pseudouridine(13) synthase TruD [Candidatus Woesearchaeota archaeon]MBT5740775.1 tRNA pseudouridine(13) synthase TruD [Candidatus Woesearchaeota archaeon]MBT7296786.1 tRNA pseudouridine(13) synthase TruD [Candidatus Woesearchaeota archaeon]
MYKIKQTDDDFIVNEIINKSKLKNKPDKNHKYVILKLTKSNFTTMDALYKIAKVFLISVKQFGIAGLKDKNGITSQYISLNRYTESMCNIEIDKDIKLEFIGWSENPIKIGDLDNNEFEIRVSCIKQLDLTISKLNLLKKIEIKLGFIPCINYFDSQRFSKNNFKQGILLLNKNFKEFNYNLIKQQSNIDFEMETIDCELNIDDFHNYEKAVVKELQKSNTDHIRALNTINPKILKIFLHSVQSYLYNLISGKLIDILFKTKICTIENINQNIYFFNDFEIEKINKLINLKIPLIGYDPNLLNSFYDDIKKLENEFDVNILDEIKIEIDNFFNEFKINQRSFILNELPQISLEGDYRNLFLKSNNFNYELVDKETLKFKFVLTKGSYATMFIKFIMCN